MCLMVAKLAEALSVRTHSSSRKIMSNTQCRPFSIIQWPRTIGPRAIEGATVTIDAIGCQLDIAQTIIDKKADYILALEGKLPPSDFPPQSSDWRRSVMPELGSAPPPRGQSNARTARGRARPGCRPSGRAPAFRPRRVGS